MASFVDSRAEKLSQLITKMVTGDMFTLSFVEVEDFHKLMVFVEAKYKPPSRGKTASRVEKMYEDSGADLNLMAMF